MTEDVRGGAFSPRDASVVISRASFTDVEIHRRAFDQFIVIGASFAGCRFRSTTFRNGSFGELRQGTPQSRYVDCTFEDVRIQRGMWPDNARFEHCRFLDSMITGWRASHAEFIDCTFTGQLRDCWFMGTTARAMYPQREQNEFKGNDFSGADIVASQFDYGIDVMAQEWPSGPRYVILDQLHARVAAARAAISRWPDDEDREYALLNLNVLSDEGMANQDAQIVRRDEWMPAKPHLRDLFFQLLDDDLHPS